MNRDLSKLLRENHLGHYVLPEQLCVGMYVHLDLSWMEHPFALSNFKIKDESQIRKIRALNLKKIRFDPLRSDVVPEFPETIQLKQGAAAPPPTIPVAAPAKALTRSNRLKQLNEAMLHGEKEFSYSAQRALEIVRTFSDHPEHSKRLATQLVSSLAGSMLAEGDVALQVITGSQTSSAYVHSLNVLILSLMLARALDMDNEEMDELGLAAVFHDAGKEEGPERKSFVDLHCEMGARMALRAGLPERVSSIILQHHEYADGSGYPKHLKAEAIDPLARILAMVNFFDNLCNPPNPALALTPYEALSQMYVGLPHKFDHAILQRLVRMLGVYPPGSLVELSNGLVGLVVSSNHDKTLQPLVMVYQPEVARETPVIIDLALEAEIKISRNLRSDQLPTETFDYLKPRRRMSFYFFSSNPKDGNPDAEFSEMQTRRSA